MLTQSDGPYTHATLIQALAAAERDVGEFFGSLSADEFVLRSASAWTPAEHLEHLNASVSAVARGLAITPWLLRIRFGRPHRQSRTYEQLRTDYLTRLEQGAGATGRFLPGRESLTDDGSMVRRTRLLSRWYHVNDRLRSALEGWTEEELDRVQLPHPILGTITAREMVFFTIYHNHHHIAATRRRLPRFSPAAASLDGTTRGPKGERLTTDPAGQAERFSRMANWRSTLFTIIAAACAVPTAFFTFYGVQLVYAAITFEGEGSLGHVGMYIAAVLFPSLALIFGGFTMLAWRRSRAESQRGPSPRNGGAAVGLDASGGSQPDGL